MEAAAIFTNGTKMDLSEECQFFPVPAFKLFGLPAGSWAPSLGCWAVAAAMAWLVAAAGY